MDWRESEKGIFLSRIYDLKRRRQFERFEEEIQTALERYPDDARFRVLLAEAHWARGRRGQAEALVAEIADSAQSIDSFHSLKATIQMARRQYPAALESYRSAHALKPGPFYLKRQADCLLQLKRFDEAWGILQSLAQQEDIYWLGAAARAMEGMGRPREAERHYRRILELSPQDSYARAQLLKLSMAEAEPETADREVDRMLRVPSRRNDAALLRVKADQLRARGSHREASEIYQKLVDLASGREKAFYKRLLAFSYYKAGMDEQAHPLLLELVRERPRDSYLRSTLIALARRRKDLAAVADFFAQLARETPTNEFLFGVAQKIRREVTPVV